MRYTCCPDGTWEWAAARPAPALRPGVLGYRGFRFDLTRARRRLELPDFMTTLVILFGQKLKVYDPVGARQAAKSTYTSVFAGMQSRARLGEHDGRLSGVEIVIAPWAAYTLFRTPMNALANQLVEPADLLGPRFQCLDERLEACPDWATRFALLDSTLTQWHLDGPRGSARVLWAWQRLNSTAGRIPVHALARECGWSERHLERRFEQQLGLLPKTAGRVLRLRGAVGLLAQGYNGASAASLSGYSDQGHLSREFKNMTGWTLSRFARTRALEHSGPAEVDRGERRPTSLVLPED
ncbi:helix-turn-helix transcriptional regulator [Streptomyces aureoverticillatus]|uniref:helix-turn-helix transcriptional regulator n=1 Tax=Streptomyces aureoverticillatus TaxID=66871 RepID=UPI0013DAC270|nr:AraC family transcriptional regulator [Streptomyces aureoverticillatus]QIB47726.1 helix-turn-helix transcriptional regulator [Streptomyces aureoverticillatus]